MSPGQSAHLHRILPRKSLVNIVPSLLSADTLAAIIMLCALYTLHGVETIGSGRCQLESSGVQG